MRSLLQAHASPSTSHTIELRNPGVFRTAFPIADLTLKGSCLNIPCLYNLLILRHFFSMSACIDLAFLITIGIQVDGT